MGAEDREDVQRELYQFNEELDAIEDELRKEPDPGTLPLESEATGRPLRSLMTEEDIAREFHETYEQLATEHGYETNAASAKPWDQVPQLNKNLMIAVVSNLLTRNVIRRGS